MPASLTYTSKSSASTLTDTNKHGQGIVVGSVIGPGWFLYFTYATDQPVILSDTSKSATVTLTYKAKN